MSATKFQPTPAQAAKEFTSANPHFEGILVVTGFTNSGRCHRLAANDYRFVVKDGACVAKHTAKWNARNGRCAGCGELFLDRVLGFVRKTGAGIVYDICPSCQANPSLTSVKFDYHAFDAALNITGLQAGITASLPVAQFVAMLNQAAQKEA